jgi:hypothetical protein
VPPGLPGVAARVHVVLTVSLPINAGVTFLAEATRPAKTVDVEHLAVENHQSHLHQDQKPADQVLWQDPAANLCRLDLAGARKDPSSRRCVGRGTLSITLSRLSLWPLRIIGLSTRHDWCPPVAPHRDCAPSAVTIQVGGWSLAFSQPRTSRSTPALTRRAAADGLKSR